MHFVDAFTQSNLEKRLFFIFYTGITTNICVLPMVCRKG